MQRIKQLITRDKEKKKNPRSAPLPSSEKKAALGKIPAASADSVRGKNPKSAHRLLRAKSFESKKEKPSLPQATSGMQRRDAALRIVRTVSTSDLKEFQNNLNHFTKNVSKFVELGYQPLVASELPSILNDASPLVPLKEFEDKKQMSSGRLTSVCLFEKDDLLYTVPFRAMLQLYGKAPDMPVLAKDGPYIYVIAAKEIPAPITADTNPTSSPKMQSLLELRVIPLIPSGHRTLINSEEERLGVVGAGEFYVHNGKIILINDKSGNFHQRIKGLGIDSRELVGKMMGTKMKNLFYPYDNDDNLIYKLDSLGFLDDKAKKTASVSTSPLSTFHVKQTAEVYQQAETEKKPTHK